MCVLSIGTQRVPRKEPSNSSCVIDTHDRRHSGQAAEVEILRLEILMDFAEIGRGKFRRFCAELHNMLYIH